jgi:hypothetical protein
VPFLFVRHGVISDWKFFLDNEDLLNLWARRFGESAVHALAEELRHLPWRAGRETSDAVAADDEQRGQASPGAALA